MERQALGLIEAVGFVSAMEATDAAAKASSIVVIRAEVTDPAYVTIYIEGELAAVQAAVEAGANAAERLGRVLSRTVIPRPHEEIGPIIDRPNQKWRGRTSALNSSVPAQQPSSAIRTEARAMLESAGRPRLATQNYEAMTVAALRRLARMRGNLPIGGREIANADKDTLVRLLRESDMR